MYTLATNHQKLYWKFRYAVWKSESDLSAKSDFEFHRELTYQYFQKVLDYRSNTEANIRSLDQLMNINPDLILRNNILNYDWVAIDNYFQLSSKQAYNYTYRRIFNDLKMYQDILKANVELINKKT